MKITEKQAIEVAKQFQKECKNYADDTIVQAVYRKEYNVTGGNAWTVIGETELFGHIKNMFYVISDGTGEVEYIFDEYGNINPHIEYPTPKEWEKYDKDNYQYKEEENI